MPAALPAATLTCTTRHILFITWLLCPRPRPRPQEKVFLPAGARIRLERLLPSASQRDYVTYEGSLTTPPCSEGLLWHVLAHPRKISHNQVG